MAGMPEHECNDIKCCHCRRTMYLHEGRRPVTVGSVKHWVCWDCFEEHYVDQKLPWITYP